jgi:hypothetical protein
MPTLKLRPVSPFESMPDVLFSLAIVAVLRVGTYFAGGIIRWAMALVLLLALLFICIRLRFRLFPKYARLSYPLDVRYVSLVGLYAGAAERDGRPALADEEFVCRFLTDAVYRNMDRATASELLRETQSKALNFVDRRELVEEFARRRPNLDVAAFEPKLDHFVRFAVDASPIRGYISEWLMADIIERRYGRVERIRYLADVITQKGG